MNAIEETLQTPVMGDYDVIVCGGGPAGCAAAIRAARCGLKTLLIEKYGFLGGSWTAGLVTPFFDTENKGGLVKEIIDRLSAEKAWGAFWGIAFDFETLKMILDDLTYEAGVEVLFHTYISAPIMEGNRVKGIIVENKEGRIAFTSEMLIDCSGDGDVAVKAGAEFKMGRDSDGATQDMTTMFLLGNVEYVPKDTKENGTYLYALMKEAIEKNNLDYEINFNSPFCINIPNGKYSVVQLTHIKGKNGVRAFELSEAERLGRKEVKKAFTIFKNYIPDFKNCELVCTAPQIGVRETRRIIGDYILSYEDLKNGKHFEDGVVDVTFNVDIHEPDSAEQTLMSSKPYQIPLSSMLPKGLEGILVAGRCISGDHIAHASYRVTGNCVAMGEAAACACSISIKNHTDVRSIDHKELKAMLNIE